MDRAAAVALAAREDRELHISLFNPYEQRPPFTLHIGLAALADYSTEEFDREFIEPSRRWARCIAGCLHVLHEQRLVNLLDERHRGLDIALYSTIPTGAGLSSSAAIQVATMMNLRDHFNIAAELDPMWLALLCQRARPHLAAAPRGIAGLVTSCAGLSGSLVKLLCQPHELQGLLQVPESIRIIGIDTGVRARAHDSQYDRTRCAAFMGHAMILAKMHEMGRAAGLRLVADPTRGYLANLPLDDYKQYFRQFLPESIRGGAFLAGFGPTTDPATRVEPDIDYPVQSAIDHHVHEPSRVRNFVQFLEQAAALRAHSPARSATLDKAGHLMYASHISYTRDALLGAPEADLLVDLVRKNEHLGLYGAKITGRGQGGTVAVLANTGEKTDAAILEIVAEYQRQTGKTAEVFWASGPGAWEMGTRVVSLDG